jgi:pimeloyl-ACP methyl ester carboxylesterase
MWSNPKGSHQNGDAIAQDLHPALAVAGESAPFVLVRHSLGRPYAMIYTKKYGDQVAGLVFVDASHPDQEQRLTPSSSTQCPRGPTRCSGSGPPWRGPAWYG